MFLSRWQSRKNILQPPTRLHLDLNMIALQPFDHKLVLLAGGEAGPDRFPGAPSADAAVFRLRNPDQTFLRHRIDRMVVHLIAKFELPAHRMLTRQGVQLLHGHQPVPRKGLLRPIPEVRLIAGIHGNRPAIRPRLMPLHRLRRRHIRRMLRHRHMVRITPGCTSPGSSTAPPYSTGRWASSPDTAGPPDCHRHRHSPRR